jgi:hypothetical protein
MIGVEIMPWCPKCKTEFQDGYKACSDCRSELVDELPEESYYVPFFQADNKKIADKLVRYFEFSDLKSAVEYDDKNEVYVVTIPADKEKQARKLYQAFYFVERDKQTIGIDEDLLPDEAETDEVQQEDDMSEESELPEELADADLQSVDKEPEKADKELEDIIPSGEFTGLIPNDEPVTYVMKEDQYKDLNGTVWIFLFFGVVGLIITVLNFVGILTFIQGLIPLSVMSFLFLFFLYVGLTTNSKAKRVRSEIEAEKKLTKEINEWLQTNVTEAFITSARNENLSDELNYIKLVEHIKSLLVQKFGEQNPAYLDRVIEEFYSNNFDSIE